MPGSHRHAGKHTESIPEGGDRKNRISEPTEEIDPTETDGEISARH